MALAAEWLKDRRGFEALVFCGGLDRFVAYLMNYDGHVIYRLGARPAGSKQELEPWFSAAVAGVCDALDMSPEELDWAGERLAPDAWDRLEHFGCALGLSSPFTRSTLGNGAVSSRLVRPTSAVPAASAAARIISADMADRPD